MLLDNATEIFLKLTKNIYKESFYLFFIDAKIIKKT